MFSPHGILLQAKYQNNIVDLPPKITEWLILIFRPVVCALRRQLVRHWPHQRDDSLHFAPVRRQNRPITSPPELKYKPVTPTANNQVVISCLIGYSLEDLIRNFRHFKTGGGPSDRKLIESINSRAIPLPFFSVIRCVRLLLAEITHHHVGRREAVRRRPELRHQRGNPRRGLRQVRRHRESRCYPRQRFR